MAGARRAQEHNQQQDRTGTPNASHSKMHSSFQVALEHLARCHPSFWARPRKHHGRKGNNFLEESKLAVCLGGNQ